MQAKQLQQYLIEWQKQGLLSDEQSQKISAYEAGKPKSSRLMLALTLLAVFAITLGLISVIAANWEDIPGWFKLTSYFLLMAGIGWQAIRWDEYAGLVREGFIFGFMLLILAGIGLIAQVFHVPSDGWRGLALWSALALLPLLRARSWHSALLWHGTFVAAWTAWFFSQRGSEVLRFETVMLCFTGLGMLASWRGSWMMPQHIRPVSLTLSLTFILLASPWMLAGILGSRSENSIVWEVATIVLGVGIWIGLLFRSRPAYTSSQLRLASYVLLLFALRLTMSLSLGTDIFVHAPNFFEALLFSVQVTLMGVFALQLNLERLFDALTLIMAARFFGLFLGLFGSLLMTGTGLILFGIAVLILLRVWYRHHDLIRARMKEIFG